MKKKKLKKIICRMLEKEDAAAVSELHSEAFFHSSVEDILKRVGHKTEKAMVATKNDGTIVGYVLFDMEKIEGVKAMYVANVGVNSQYRGRGVCGEMLPWLVGRLGRHRCKYAFLSVFKDNESAQRCYKRVGFRAKDNGSMMRMEYVPKKKRAAKKKAA